MEKKTILAVVLSAVIIMGYQFYITKYYPAPVGTNANTTTAINETLPQLPAGESVGKIAEPAASETEISNLPEKIINIDTNKYAVTLSSIGGCIKSIQLKEHVTSMATNGFSLINITDPQDGIFNMDSLGAYRISGANFSCEQKEGEVIFTANIGGKIEVIKKYIFHNSSYIIDLEVYIKNVTDRQLMAGYFINTGSHIGVDSPIDKRYIQAVAEIGGKVKRNGGGKRDGLFIKGNVSYAGLQNRYFSVIAKTDLPTEGLLVKRLADENVSSAIKVIDFAILPRAMVSQKFELYAGPTDKNTMGQYGLVGAANYGFLGGVSDILLAGLKLFHKIFKNWGIAIILLSILVNMILFPLSRKSYE
ncbi:MAG: membrane protein insertase YidC, partial [Candidatus Omnitrophica bacterium]|nr:membrane protein insertase YidC [Candidatus Omnitrophota bacterium]